MSAVGSNPNSNPNPPQPASLTAVSAVGLGLGFRIQIASLLVGLDWASPAAVSPVELGFEDSNRQPSSPAAVSPIELGFEDSNGQPSGWDGLGELAEKALGLGRASRGGVRVRVRAS